LYSTTTTTHQIVFSRVWSLNFLDKAPRRIVRVVTRRNARA